MIDDSKYDPNDPEPWLALELDQSTFIEEKVKQALMNNNRSRSRQFLMPVVRPIARLSIVFMQLIRIALPNKLTSTKWLHKTISWGMSNFVCADANYLIVRHFNIGTQILKFLGDNVENATINTVPLRPKTIKDLEDNVFVQHDLNVYNFIIQLNQHLRANGTDIQTLPLEKINFIAIEDFDDQLQTFPNRWHNFLDLQTAIEVYTPLFGMFLSDSYFWRASNSLQLDETVAIYAAKIFGESYIASSANNGHPMVPLTTLQAGFRLMLHGLDAENLYGHIKAMKKKQSGVSIS